MPNSQAGVPKKLYCMFFPQFSSLHSTISVVFQLETPACWEGKFVVQEIWSLKPEQMEPPIG